MTLPVLHEADVVIVGAGSAGSWLAQDLAQDGKLSVCVIEAGGAGRNPLLRVPLMTGVLLRSDRYTWPFRTAPQAGLAGRQLNWPRGRVLGGSGAINGMVWVRGLPMDYAGWEGAGLTGWGWDDVRPWFEKIEALPADHGGKALGIERPSWWTELYDRYLAAGQSAGHALAEDFNAPGAEGVGRYRFNIRGGRRAHTGALLAQAVRAGRLRAFTGCLTQRVEITEGRATGVVVRQNGQDVLIRARKEVVLCAGTIGSPHILMHSGIGAGVVLRAAGVTPLVNSPEVGQGIQDHLLVRVEHAALRPGALHRLLRIDRAALAMAQALMFGTGPASCFPLLTGGYLRSAPGLNAPDIQAHFMPALSSATLRVNPFHAPKGMPAQDGFFINVFQMRPESRGEIRIVSPDPAAHPVIDPRYLSAPGDRNVLRDAVGVVRRIFAQEPFDGWRGRELSPGEERTSDEALDAWISQTADTVFHPTGGCCMGTVTDARLRVKGVAGLRVADASVMPRITSNNTNAPTVMIAARCADFIRQDG